jgi:histidinol-phosphatase (PHP family)
MIKYDYHIHTQYSYDSNIKAQDLMAKAILLGYKDIAITEHLDLLPQELSVYGLPSLKRYQEYCLQLQRDYPELKVRMGIEIGDYHQVQSFAEELIREFDFCPILGSVHFLSDHTNVAIPLAAELDKDQIEDYYRQNLALVSSCKIDILAHLGVYKRYYSAPPDESHVAGLIDEIFRTIIARGIALEINLSSLRKPYAKIIPEAHLIGRYRALGGKLISIGSDSHHIEHFAEIPHSVLEISKYFLPPLLK